MWHDLDQLPASRPVSTGVARMAVVAAAATVPSHNSVDFLLHPLVVQLHCPPEGGGISVNRHAAAPGGRSHRPEAPPPLPLAGAVSGVDPACSNCR